MFPVFVYFVDKIMYIAERGFLGYNKRSMINFYLECDEMECKKKKLPIGIENFEKIQLGEFYYVDKTNLIKELLENYAEVTLFTRPRRFGKTLNMSMLRSFFDLNGNYEIFRNLRITQETEVCEEYMGKYPVISISLKGINAQTYENALEMAVQIINGEARKFRYLLEGNQLTEYDKKAYIALLQPQMGGRDSMQ